MVIKTLSVNLNLIYTPIWRAENYVMQVVKKEYEVAPVSN
jgi:hypothetical protein